MKRAAYLSFVLYAVTFGALVWSCSSPPYYPGGGRDLGPQGMPMGGGDSGQMDTGTMDTGVKDGGADSSADTGGGG